MLVLWGPILAICLLLEIKMLSITAAAFARFYVWCFPIFPLNVQLLLLLVKCARFVMLK